MCISSFTQRFVSPSHTGLLCELIRCSVDRASILRPHLPSFPKFSFFHIQKTSFRSAKSKNSRLPYSSTSPPLFPPPSTNSLITSVFHTLLSITPSLYTPNSLRFSLEIPQILLLPRLRTHLRLASPRSVKPKRISRRIPRSTRLFLVSSRFRRFRRFRWFRRFPRFRRFRRFRTGFRRRVAFPRFSSRFLRFHQKVVGRFIGSSSSLRISLSSIPAWPLASLLFAVFRTVLQQPNPSLPIVAAVVSTVSTILSIPSPAAAQVPANHLQALEFLAGILLAAVVRSRMGVTFRNRFSPRFWRVRKCASF